MSKAATRSFQTSTSARSSTRSSATWTASIPGARRIISSVFSVIRTSVMRGSSRCETNRPVASTTIQERSRSMPVSTSSPRSRATPAHDFTG